MKNKVFLLLAVLLFVANGSVFAWGGDPTVMVSVDPLHPTEPSVIPVPGDETGGTVSIISSTSGFHLEFDELISSVTVGVKNETTGQLVFAQLYTNVTEITINLDLEEGDRYSVQLIFEQNAQADI